jgi:hypothetical protein
LFWPYVGDDIAAPKDLHFMTQLGTLGNRGRDHSVI